MICEAHSKSAFCEINGKQLRWCQQCRRFQTLEEFDDERRTCRARLNRHNHLRKRRKPEGKSFGQPKSKSRKPKQALANPVASDTLTSSAGPDHTPDEEEEDEVLDMAATGADGTEDLVATMSQPLMALTAENIAKHVQFNEASSDFFGRELSFNKYLGASIAVELNASSKPADATPPAANTIGKEVTDEELLSMAEELGFLNDGFLAKAFAFEPHFPTTAPAAAPSLAPATMYLPQQQAVPSHASTITMTSLTSTTTAPYQQQGGPILYRTVSAPNTLYGRPPLPPTSYSYKRLNSHSAVQQYPDVNQNSNNFQWMLMNGPIAEHQQPQYQQQQQQQQQEDEDQADIDAIAAAAAAAWPTGSNTNQHRHQSVNLHQHHQRAQQLPMRNWSAVGRLETPKDSNDAPNLDILGLWQEYRLESLEQTTLGHGPVPSAGVATTATNDNTMNCAALPAINVLNTNRLGGLNRNCNINMPLSFLQGAE